MKTVFIKINDVSEINTSKISVHDLNNRYIDKDGKMYGLKYNRKTRKVSIIRIIRTTAKSADYFNQIIKTQRKEIKSNNQPDTENEINNEEPETAEEENDTSFHIDIFVNETIELMQTHRHRMAGIMMNIKNSRIIPETDREYFGQLEDIFRNLEIDGLLRIDKALVAHRELKNYPRSITYYIAKLDSKSRRIIDQLDTDARKMSYIYASEIYHSIKSLYRTLLKILNDLRTFLDKINPDEARDISGTERQFFHDAKISIDNTVSEIEGLVEQIKLLEDYLNDSENF